MSRQPKIKEYRSIAGPFTILSAKSSDGVGTEFDVSQYRHVGVEIATTGSANLTLKCQGSFKELADIDFSVAASPSNPWDYISIHQYRDATIDASVTFSGTDDVLVYEVNSNTLRSLNFEVSGHVAGAVTVVIYPVNNQ